MRLPSFPRLAGLAGVLGGALLAVTSFIFYAPGLLNAPAYQSLRVYGALDALAFTLALVNLSGLASVAWVRRSPLAAWPFALAFLGTLAFAVLLVPLNAPPVWRDALNLELRLTPAGVPVLDVYGLTPLAVTLGWMLAAWRAQRVGALGVVVAMLFTVALPVGAVLAAGPLAAFGGPWAWPFAFARQLGPLFSLGLIGAGLSLWVSHPAALPMPRVALGRQRARSRLG